MKGITVPKILLPKKAINPEFMHKWAVIAVDQYTSEPEYWKKVELLTRDHKSTYHLILPEIYLEDKNVDDRIKKINSEMNNYLQEDVFEEFEGFILIDRKTINANSRKGLIVALDLEHYDFNKNSKTLIRATEGTIIERLPPRIKIRKNAPIELPHIMVLINDPKKTVIEPLFNLKIDVAYDFDLMMDSGHIIGYKLSKNYADKIFNALEKLIDNDLLFAVGDGNHSLATAKVIWEDIKKNNPTIKEHPSRYALVELVNIHDEGLKFEPIHRVVFNANINDMFFEMKKFYEEQECSITDNPNGKHSIECVYDRGKKYININQPKNNLEVGTLQSFLDYYCKTKGLKIDYIHGEDVVNKLARNNNIGFILPAMSKNEFFKTVILEGALPRKTFSMGEASEKRFYIEARKII